MFLLLYVLLVVRQNVPTLMDCSNRTFTLFKTVGRRIVVCWFSLESVDLAAGGSVVVSSPGLDVRVLSVVEDG